MNPPSYVRSMMLDVLRQRLKILAMSKMTDESREYRRKAQALARRVDGAPDDMEALKIVHEALAWIQLAENEEMLAEDGASTSEQKQRQ